MDSIEVTGATVQEAIDAGMQELGVDSPSQVMVEVVQEPDQGIMGEGARPAIVRLVYMGLPPAGESVTSIISDPQAAQAPQTAIVAEPYVPPEDDEDDDEPLSQTEEVALEDADEDAQVGAEVLGEILEKMGIEGNISIMKATSSRSDEGVHWGLNIKGRNMSRLIGRRGETLSSLQYITRLIVSRKLQRRANIIVDADGYKMKRSERLSVLAKRMADQAVRQGRTVTLEPMPPHERRIIHLTLRQRTDVTTRSVGEGDGRKVTISPER